jgi:hypothetical protein
VKAYGHHSTSSPAHPNAFVLRMTHVSSDSYLSVGKVAVLTLSGELCVLKTMPYSRTSFILKKFFKIFGVMVPNTKRIVLTKKDKVNIVNRLKKDESGKKLAEEYGVGTFNSLDI